MGWEPIAIATGVVLIGLLIFSVISSARREQREEADRQKFFKAVEDARQKQIEVANQDRSISGMWKGEGTGFFGVGRRLEFKFTHTGNSISGHLKDEYGEAVLAGYFVWPYIMFDVRRDDTSFEFRGTVGETGIARSIQGKYRYSTTDSNWSVKEVVGNQTTAAHAGSPGDISGTGGVGEQNPAVAEQTPAPRGQKPVAEPSIAEHKSVMAGAENAKEPDVVPNDLSDADPLPGLQTETVGNECLQCHRPLDANFEFCIYCGQGD